jgi:hypothetical protein
MTNKPLTDDELARLRLILDQDEKMQWLWSSLRRTSAGIFAMAAVLVAFRHDVSILIQWIAGK